MTSAASQCVTRHFTSLPGLRGLNVVDRGKRGDRERTCLRSVLSVCRHGTTLNQRVDKAYRTGLIIAAGKLLACCDTCATDVTRLSVALLQQPWHGCARTRYRLQNTLRSCDLSSSARTFSHGKNNHSPRVTVGPARTFCRPFRVQQSTFDRSFSGTLIAASQFVPLSSRSRAAAYSRAGTRIACD